MPPDRVGDYLAVYYANDGDVRMGGLIANVKDLAYDKELIEKFAAKIGTRVIYYLEWNKVVYEAERRRQNESRIFRPESAGEKNAGGDGEPASLDALT